MILGGVAVNDEPYLNEQVEEILSLCKVIGAYPVLVTEREKPSAKDIFCVCLDELSEIRSPEDFVASV